MMYSEHMAQLDKLESKFLMRSVNELKYLNLLFVIKIGVLVVIKKVLHL